MRALLLTALPLACAWAPLPGIGDSAQRHASRRLARPAASRPAWAGRSGVARPMGLLDTFLAKGVDEDDIARIALERDNEKIAGVYDALVARVNAAEKTVEKLDDAGVRAAAEALRADAAALAADAREPDDLRVQGLALAREAAWRVLRQRPYDVQLVGGLALLDGRLAEMATGEGKVRSAAQRVERRCRAVAVAASRRRRRAVARHRPPCTPRPPPRPRPTHPSHPLSFRRSPPWGPPSWPPRAGAGRAW